MSQECEPRWHWRNCRDLGFSLDVWPPTWRFGIDRDFDVYGGTARINCGPISFAMHANIGNCSSPNRFEAWRGLGEANAWARAAKWEGR